MSSIKTIREKIPSIEDSLFNSKLFLNVNLSNEQNLNSSFAKDSENPNEIDDITSTCFLSKDLMDEINSSDSDISLKDEKPSLDKNLFLNLVKGGDKYISNWFTNNIGNKDLFPYDFNQRNNNIFFNCRDYMNSYNTIGRVVYFSDTSVKAATSAHAAAASSYSGGGGGFSSGGGGGGSFGGGGGGGGGFR